MSVKKIIGTLATGAMLAAATPVFADHFQRAPFRNVGLTSSELDTISQFESEANYRRFVHELSVKYGVSTGDIERMARPARQQRVSHEPSYRGHRGESVYRGEPVYHGQPVYRGHPVYQGQPVYAAPAYSAPYYVEHRDNTAAVLGGAALGAMVGSQVGDHNTRPAAMAFGAVIGAILGNELTDR